jgi:4-aminobutyrate aminotransferase/(S)-3-amino-2-methylpropionate transaminase
VIVPPSEFLPELARMAHAKSALLIADEIWTGLGRSGKMLASLADDVLPDIVCLGKGLGGGLPISAVIGRESVMQAWQREAEVVHTSTFAGAALPCVTAIATLDVLSREDLVDRAADLGERVRAALTRRLAEGSSVKQIRGAGLMLGIDLGDGPAAASRLQKRLLEAGYITSTGGGQREVLVLTPALNISEPLLFGFVEKLALSVQAFAS